MDALHHAHLAKRLLDRCGGVDAVLSHEVLSRSRDRATLYRYADPNRPDIIMPADVIADLEAYCGEPVYSRALVEARPSAPEVESALDEACDVVRDAGQLLELARRLNKRGGVATLHERLKAAEIYGAIQEELRGFEAAIATVAGGQERRA